MFLFLCPYSHRFSLAGKKRLWVITAPSHSDQYLRMMEKQLEEMEQVLLCNLFWYIHIIYSFFRFKKKFKLAAYPSIFTCFIWLFLSLPYSERPELPFSRKRYVHCNYHSECYDGGTDPENNFSRRCHSWEPGPRHGYQTAALPGAYQPSNQCAINCVIHFKLLATYKKVIAFLILF